MAAWMTLTVETHSAWPRLGCGVVSRAVDRFIFFRLLVSAWWGLAGLSLLCGLPGYAWADSGALDGVQHRVIVSTDVGGTDPDDFQSLVHFLLYADGFEIEGLISSPYGPGRKEHILEVIAQYERDFPNLRSHSSRYPTPDALRAISRQGASDDPGYAGVGRSTAGSDWIIQCARRDDPRPLWVLVWGGIEDLAQALHDAPDILPKLRVYFIGGPNKMWSVNAYSYIERHHPRLWMIEANATYRGWFVGGDQSGEWGNKAFVERHLAGRGAMGTHFATQLRGTIKMGDSPSVGYLLRGTPENPAQPGWGGRFVRIWDGRTTTFDRLTTADDRVEAFGVIEIKLALPPGMTREHQARLWVDNRIPMIGDNDGRTVRFRFSPRDAKLWPYVVQSDFPALHGKTGAFTAVLPLPDVAHRPSPRLPNWWIDDPALEWREGVHLGAKTVNQWRREFLADFAARIQRCSPPPENPR